MRFATTGDEAVGSDRKAIQFGADGTLPGLWITCACCIQTQSLNSIRSFIAMDQTKRGEPKNSAAHATIRNRRRAFAGTYVLLDICCCDCPTRLFIRSGSGPCMLDVFILVGFLTRVNCHKASEMCACFFFFLF